MGRLINEKSILNVGIIGIGFGQAVLLPAFRSHSKVEVLAIAATSLERALNVAKSHDIPRAYGSWQEMVNDNDLDALAIAVPPLVQEEIIPAALLNNKHLFCEKPLGLCNEKTKLFVLEAQKRNLANMIDFEFCAIPAWRQAREYVSSGILGAMQYGTLNWQTETYAHRMQLDTWKLKPEKGGGVLLQFASHVLYNLEWLCGSISEVFVTLIPSFKKDVAVHGILRFANGLVLNIAIGNESHGISVHCIEIYGKNGSFRLANNTTDYVNGFKLSSVFKDNTVKPNIITTHDVASNRVLAVKELVQLFVHWMITGEHQEPSFKQGHRVDCLIKSCIISNKNRSWVSVNGGMQR